MEELKNVLGIKLFPNYPDVLLNYIFYSKRARGYPTHEKLEKIGKNTLLAIQGRQLYELNMTKTAGILSKMNDVLNSNQTFTGYFLQLKKVCYTKTSSCGDLFMIFIGSVFYWGFYIEGFKYGILDKIDRWMAEIVKYKEHIMYIIDNNILRTHEDLYFCPLIGECRVVKPNVKPNVKPFVDAKLVVKPIIKADPLSTYMRYLSEITHTKEESTYNKRISDLKSVILNDQDKLFVKNLTDKLEQIPYKNIQNKRQELLYDYGKLLNAYIKNGLMSTIITEQVLPLDVKPIIKPVEQVLSNYLQQAKKILYEKSTQSQYFDYIKQLDSIRGKLTSGQKLYVKSFNDKLNSKTFKTYQSGRPTLKIMLEKLIRTDTPTSVALSSFPSVDSDIKPIEDSLPPAGERLAQRVAQNLENPLVESQTSSPSSDSEAESQTSSPSSDSEAESQINSPPSSDSEAESQINSPPSSDSEAESQINSPSSYLSILQYQRDNQPDEDVRKEFDDLVNSVQNSPSAMHEREQLQKHFDANRKKFFILHPAQKNNQAILKGITDDETRQFSDLRRKIYNDWLLKHSPSVQQLISETHGTHDIEKIKEFFKVYNNVKFDNKSIIELKKLFIKLNSEILTSTNLPEMLRKLRDFTKIKTILAEKRPQDNDFNDKIAHEVYKKVGNVFINEWKQLGR